ncbi:DUF2529 domain-containing protein [Bacillus songklensis]|uniref:DUF2529 domain-containing protein n=1 Tax=Bacillus songklensis TaxID=1069116 RepID=A0ABV8B7S6_9BACI
MLKIFTTQLTGYFKRIQEQEEFHIEDGARILAQASIGDGTIYIYGTDEMQAVGLEATMGPEPLPGAKLMASVDEVENVDRVLLVSRFSSDPHMISVAQQLQKKNIPIVGISVLEHKENSPSLEEFVDVHIDTKLLKPLIPDEEGNRYGFPAIMTALYAYYGLYLTVKEIIAEYE